MTRSSVNLSCHFDIVFVWHAIILLSPSNAWPGSQSRRHRGAFVGLAPKRNFKPPKLKCEIPYISNVFARFQNVKPPLHKPKAPQWKLSGDGSAGSATCNTTFCRNYDQPITSSLFGNTEVPSKGHACPTSHAVDLKMAREQHAYSYGTNYCQKLVTKWLSNLMQWGCLIWRGFDIIWTWRGTGLNFMKNSGTHSHSSWTHLLGVQEHITISLERRT